MSGPARSPATPSIGQSHVVLIRCWPPDYREAVVLFDLLTGLGARVYLVYAADAPPESVPPALEGRIIQIDESFLIRAGLHTPAFAQMRWAWQCGDLTLYAGHERVTDAEYFWLLEPDVYAEPELFRRLLAQPLRDDLYGPNLRREEEGWFWYPAARRYFPEVWACNFAPVAVRRARVPGLQAARARVVAEWSASGGKPADLPNDESFVCSYLKANGGRCADLNELFPMYGEKTIRFGLPRSRKAVMWHPTERHLLFHPVCSGEEFHRKAENRMRDMGLSYAEASDILFEKSVLPIAPGIDQLTTVAYMGFVQPAASLRRARFFGEAIAARLGRMLRSD